MRHRTSISISLLLGVAILMMVPSGRAHEPITTKVMFNKEVIRILQRNCLACHSPGRIKADISLTTYQEARPWAKAIKEEVLEKRMMPFQAVKGYGAFRHSYALPQRDQELLISWIEGGAPKGEEKDYPREEIEKLANGQDWPAGEPDLVLQPAKETRIPAEAEDDLRCHELPARMPEPRWIGQIGFQPGNGTVVHSASFFLATPAQKAPCSLPEARLQSLGEWVPGQAPLTYPAGMARRLPANAQVILKIRYRGNGEDAIDRSRLGFYFAKTEVQQSIDRIAIAPVAATLPANAESHRIVASRLIEADSEGVGIRPLLYPYATSVEATVTRPDGSCEVLILARNYRYPWQPTYYFKEPISLPKGSRITVTAYLNNGEEKPARFAQPLCEIVTSRKI